MSNVTRLPEVGRGPVVLRDAEILTFPDWYLRYCLQTLADIQIYTDEPSELTVRAPGTMTYPQAKAWADHKMPPGFMLVEVYRA